MSRYRENKKAAITHNIDTATGEVMASVTDQSQAHDTDINVIVGRFLKTGGGVTSPGKPMYGDFSELPDGLRGFIRTAQSLNSYRNQLPESLRELTTEQLLMLTPSELASRLKPPTPTPAPPTEEPPK